MNRDEIRRLYDATYAASYESKFIHGGLAKVDSDFELDVIKGLLKPGKRWLDCACGTGYYLSKFPDQPRAGADLSPSMIEQAREANPGVDFTEWDLREPKPEWVGQWDLVSCMWYAYGLVDSLREVFQVIENLAAWTSPTGTLFLPYSDPRIIARANYPYETTDTPWDGRVFIDGIIWTYAEDDGTKRHDHMISPTPELLRSKLEKWFGTIETVDYPPAIPGWEQVRRAFVAKDKIATS